MGPYGLQRFGPAPEARLVCLDQVLDWLCLVKEMPQRRALRMVFGRLIELDEADAPCRKTVLYVINCQDYAVPLEQKGLLNPLARDVWSELDFAYEGLMAQGTVREIADRWEESWPGYVTDAAKFYQQGWVRYCKAFQYVAQREYGPHRWHEEYRKRCYITQEDWRERCQACMKAFRLLAVPLSVANELWGWGRTVEVVAQTDAQAAPSATAAPLTAEDVKTFPDLVQYRQRLAGGQKLKTAPPWPAHHVALFAERLQQECEQGRERGAVERIAVELLATRQALAGVLKRHGYSHTTGQALPKRLQRANAMGDMANSLKTGTTGC